MDTKSRFNQYIDSVLNGVRFNEAHTEIRKELMSHLDEAKELTSGLNISENEVEVQVIQRMGDPANLGKTFDHVHQPKIDALLVGMVCLLLAVGLFAMFQLGHIGLHSLWMITGIIPMTALVFLKPSFVRDRGWAIYVSTAALCILAALIGQWFEGQPYLSLGPVSIKIVDLSVVLFVMGLAGPIVKSSGKSNFVAFGGTLVPLIAYSTIGSFYPAILFMCSCLAMMIASKQSKMTVLIYSIVGTAFVAFSLRNGSFVSGAAYAEALSSEKHTDFVFMSLSNTSSVLAIITAAIAVALIAYLSSINKAVKSIYGRTVSTGALTIIGIGIVWGLLSSLGFIPMPTSGVYFPFLSYSGSLMMGHLALIGLILGVQRRRNLHFI